MVTVHRMLVARLGDGPLSAVLLDTPYLPGERRRYAGPHAACFARSIGWP